MPGSKMQETRQKVRWRCQSKGREKRVKKKKLLLGIAPPGKSTTQKWSVNCKYKQNHVVNVKSIVLFWNPPLPKYLRFLHWNTINEKLFIGVKLISISDYSKRHFSLEISNLDSFKWHPTPVFLPGKSHGRRNLGGCSPWGLRVGHDWVTSLLLRKKSALWEFYSHQTIHSLYINEKVLKNRMDSKM